MTIGRTLEREAATGWRRLSGTHIAGAVHIDQTIANETLQAHRPEARDVRLEFEDANTIIVRYRRLRFRAWLDEEMDLAGSPRVRVRLASMLLGWTLTRALTLPYVRVQGRWVIVDVGALPATDEYRAMWQHVRSVRFTTSPGKLVVHFTVQIA
ncbi:MAG: hypothetical protein ABR606_18925 [Vicinamibacterales bacterium]